MFLATRQKDYQSTHQSQVGTTTLGGNPAGVYLSGERRNLYVVSPKGYSWTPSQGDSVLVIKSGEQGEQGYVAGVPSSQALPSGTIQIANESGTSSITLDEDGNLYLVGKIYANGTLISPLATGEEG